MSSYVNIFPLFVAIFFAACTSQSTKRLKIRRIRRGLMKQNIIHFERNRGIRSSFVAAWIYGINWVDFWLSKDFSGISSVGRSCDHFTTTSNVVCLQDCKRLAKHDCGGAVPGWRRIAYTSYNCRYYRDFWVIDKKLCVLHLNPYTQMNPRFGAMPDTDIGQLFGAQIIIRIAFALLDNLQQCENTWCPKVL